jgi:hypothetical protein
MSGQCTVLAPSGCTNVTDGVAGYCDGSQSSCLRLKSLGELCSLDLECALGHCVSDGGIGDTKVCCASSCTVGANTECRTGLCPAGACSLQPPFAPCTNPSRALGYCDGSTAPCQRLKEIGELCAVDGECRLHACVSDGSTGGTKVCCASNCTVGASNECRTGLCPAGACSVQAPQTCTNVTNGALGYCDGSTAPCQALKQLGEPCTLGVQCVGSGNCVVDGGMGGAKVCCASSCAAGTSGNECLTGQCAVGSGQCTVRSAQLCTKVTNGAPGYCDGLTAPCLPLKLQGEQCAAALECATMQCVTGVCCGAAACATGGSGNECGTGQCLLGSGLCGLLGSGSCTLGDTSTLGYCNGVAAACAPLELVGGTCRASSECLAAQCESSRCVGTIGDLCIAAGALPQCRPGSFCSSGLTCINPCLSPCSCNQF